MRISYSGIRWAGMIKLLPFQGALLIAIIPRAMPWARSFWAFSPFLNPMRKLTSFTLLNMPLLIEFQHIDIEDGEVFRLKLVLLRLEQVILSCS